MKLNNNFYLQISLVAFFANIKPRNMGKHIQYFPFSGTFASRFHYQKEKTVQNWAQQSSTKVCFDENKQTHAFFTGKLSGHSDLPESVLKWVFPVFCPVSQVLKETYIPANDYYSWDYLKVGLSSLFVFKISNFQGCRSIEQAIH